MLLPMFPDSFHSGAPDSATWAPELQKTRVYEALLTDIVLGDLPPGAVLVERALAARRGWGLAGVRDALGRLALEGLIVRRPRVGATVAPLDVREIEEAFEVRRLLDARAAGLAARNARTADVEALTTAFDGAEAAVARADLRALVEMDRAFHRAVAAATHNALLARWLVHVHDTAARWWVFAMARQDPAEQLADVRLHRDLAAAIAGGGVREAEAAMARLIGDPPSLASPALTPPGVRRTALDPAG